MKSFEELCDVYIINTCTVTNTSDIKSRKMIRNAIKKNPDACVVAMGCFIEANKDYEIEGLDIVIGNKDKSKILDYINDYLNNKEQIVKFYDMNDVPFEDMEVQKYNKHHRAFIKIEDGCNNFCSYCIIPYVRGRVRSKNYDKCINEARDLVNSGHKEIVLAGIHTGQYNDDGKRLCDVINGLSKIDGLERIRLSSVEIVELDEGMLEILKNNNKFVSHLHIPLQAGSNNVLKLMNRRYTREEFIDMVNNIKKLRPGISLSTDIIVGFPGETDEDFDDTLELSREVGFSKIHVFPYSDRNGTVASKMKNKVDGNIKKQRVHKLMELSNVLERKYFEENLDSEVEVLIEEYKDGYYYGFTSNYIPLKLSGNYQINEIYKIKLRKEDINFDMNN